MAFTQNFRACLVWKVGLTRSQVIATVSDSNFIQLKYLNNGFCG
ncbi:hypothetical protein Hdeb2414_s0007g00259401 [Helianthus debilis subsp. tardiflorus]